MARKDARLMLEEAARHNIPLGVISAVAKLYDEAIARELNLLS
jgi:3-hydroxyisobutyrate dehydrogenase-like beta-hydroxyacid dehydrogenase